MSVFNDLVSMLTSIFGYLYISSVGYVKSLKYFTKNNLENDKNEEGTSGENTVDCRVKPMSLYSHNLVKAHEKFPTVLELLECDSPWIKQMLVRNQGLDKILVVPKFEECTSLLDSLDRDFTIAGKFLNFNNIGNCCTKNLLGVDANGAVFHLGCDAIQRYDDATVGYVEYPCANFDGDEMRLHFWDDRDISYRWPLFKELLEKIPTGDKLEETDDESEDSDEWSEEELMEREVEENQIRIIRVGRSSSDTSDLGPSPELSNSDVSSNSEVEDDQEIVENVSDDIEQE